MNLSAAALPTPTPVSNSYQVFPFFTGADNACQSAVYLLPPSFTYKQPSQPLQLQYLSPSSTATGSYGNTDFQLSLAKGVASVTLTGKNMWNCAAASRATLMANFVDFLKNVESQFELQGTLVPGATQIIGQQVADNLPASPVESLFYRYSLSTGLAAQTIPYVDIRPGMRLRVETEASQFLTPGSRMNGYVGAGRFSYYVSSVPPASAGARNLTFDPFLGAIRTPTVSGGQLSPVVAGGLFDLAPVSGARAYWRLFYPQTVSAPSQPGDLTTADNVALVGAATLGQLYAATPGSTGGATGQTPNVTAIFSGRSVVVPEIPIWISAYNQTTLEYVPVGTTIANIVERYAAVPLNTAQPKFVGVRRPTTAVQNSATAPINLFPQPLPGGTIPPAVFDVPLIAGDSVTLSLQ
ncbi:MAG TPA: hypothetical protein VER32_05280 [Pyrinomonadaceae bacterium]|nr:hypothetical protein [Pyrinomonadaceae bacterium]